MILYESFLHHFSKNLLQCKAPVYSHLPTYVNFTTVDHQPYCVLYRNLTDLSKSSLAYLGIATRTLFILVFMNLVDIFALYALKQQQLFIKDGD